MIERVGEGDKKERRKTRRKGGASAKGRSGRMRPELHPTEIGGVE